MSGPRGGGATVAPWALAAGALVVLAAVVLAGVAMVGVAMVLSAMAAVAAEPTLTAAPVIEAGDPRSDGAGPGLVGSPLMILLGVMALGLATVGVTAVIARLTRRD